MDGHDEWHWRGRRRGPVRMPLFVALVQVLGTVFAARSQDAQLTGTAFALLVAGPLALTVRARYPVLALLGTLAATVAYSLLAYPKGPFFLAAIVGIASAIRARRQWPTWILCAAAYVTFVVGYRDPPSLTQSVVVAAWLAVVLAISEGSRARSEHFAEVSRARNEAARARTEQSRRQASEERLRIARELHDVLGHHLSLINVRAGVALHLLDTKPDPTDQAREALAAIKAASAEALREVRAVLATLRPEDESAPRTPAPGMAELDALIAEARAAGLSVTVRLEGRPHPLPPEVERAAYRIAQEALTNVRRHAGPSAAATVTVAYTEDALRLRVEDDGKSTVDSVDDSGRGNGIPGMRERATGLGGSLVAEPLAGGGFQVETVLPTGGGTA